MEDSLFWIVTCTAMAAMALVELGGLFDRRRPVNAPAVPPGPASLTVLVVEHHEALRASLCALVARRGHRAVPAKSVEAALLLSQRQRPDIVLLDQDLPALDGVQGARSLRANGSEAKMVLLSPGPCANTSWRARAAGIDSWLQKPVKAECLAALLDSSSRR